MPNIGPTELIIVLVLALLILGPKRLPDAGRSLGRAIREFKDGLARNDVAALSDEGSTLRGPHGVRVCERRRGLRVQRGRVPGSGGVQGVA
jgi:sec-independent protein translocase protein TatA